MAMDPTENKGEPRAQQDDTALPPLKQREEGSTFEAHE